MVWLRFLALTAILLVMESVKAGLATIVFRRFWASKKLVRRPVRLDVVLYELEETVDEIVALWRDMVYVFIKTPDAARVSRRRPWECDGRWFAPRRYQEIDTKCFQSDGVIFVTFRDFGEWLYVYDTRYDRSAAAKRLPADYAAAEEWTTCSVSMTRLGRLRSGDGEIEAWRIRVIDGYLTQTTTEEELADLGSRACLVKTTYDLRIRCACCGEEDSVATSQEEVMWNKFADPPVLHVMRTSGSIGLWSMEYGMGTGPAMMFSGTADAFVFYASIFDLLDSDVAFRKWSTNTWIFDPDKLRPLVLTAREIVACSFDGVIYRLALAPDLLKYSAVKAIFRSTPGLRYRMTAGQFRDICGVTGMDQHFG